MSLDKLKENLQNAPENIVFADVMEVVAELYNYTPTTFSNGKGDDVVVNEAGTNEGSCRLFALAKDQGFTEQQTLDCFGQYYREDVLKNPEGSDHANIRNFMKYGWEGISFSGEALTRK